MKNNTDINNEILEDLFKDDLDGAVVDGFVDTENRNAIEGYTDLIAFFPDQGRAAHVSNGDVCWFDARSLDDAMNASGY